MVSDLGPSVVRENKIYCFVVHLTFLRHSTRTDAHKLRPCTSSLSLSSTLMVSPAVLAESWCVLAM